MKQYLFLSIVIFLLSPFNASFAESSSNELQVEVGSITTKDLYDQINSLKQQQNEKIQEIKDETSQSILLIKDDRIMQLNNFIYWGIAVATILLTVISFGWSWAFKKVNDSRKTLDQQLSDANILINQLNESRNKILNDQEKINKILSSDYFELRLKKFEKNMDRLEDSVKEWDLFYKEHKDKQFTMNRMKLLNNFSSNLRVLLGGPFPDRLSADEMERVLKINEMGENIEDYSNEELQTLSDELEKLFYKHRSDDDDYGYMV